MSDDYLRRLEHELRDIGCTAPTRARILSEIGEHIREADTAGHEFNEDVQLGNPRDLADAFALASWLGARRRMQRTTHRVFLAVVLWVGLGQGTLALTDKWPTHDAGWGLAQLTIWIGLSLTFPFANFGADPFGRTPRQQQVVVGVSCAAIVGAVLVAAGLGFWTLNNAAELPVWWITGSALGASFTIAFAARTLGHVRRLTHHKRAPADAMGEKLRDVVAALLTLDEPPLPPGRVGRLFARIDPMRWFNRHPPASLLVATVVSIVVGHAFTQAYANAAGGRVGLLLVSAVALGLVGNLIQVRRPQRAVRS